MPRSATAGVETHLVNLTHHQIAEYLRENDTILVPCGATEQHAAHLPIGVDAMTAIAVAEDAARESGVLVAPPINYGWSPHHMGFSGTVSLRPETLSSLAEDVAISLLHHGFTRVIFVNGHRIANVPPLAIATTRVRNRTGALVVVADLAYLAQPEYAAGAETGSEGIGHADGYETAHMLHIHPQLVRLENLPEGPEQPSQDAAHPPMREIDPSRASSRAAWWPSTEAELAGSSGGSGDPTWGDAAKGESLHRAMVRDLTGLISQVQAAPVTCTVPPAPN